MAPPVVTVKTDALFLTRLVPVGESRIAGGQGEEVIHLPKCNVLWIP